MPNKSGSELDALVRSERLALSDNSFRASRLLLRGRALLLADQYRRLDIHSVRKVADELYIRAFPKGYFDDPEVLDGPLPPDDPNNGLGIEESHRFLTLYRFSQSGDYLGRFDVPLVEFRAEAMDVWEERSIVEMHIGNGYVSLKEQLSHPDHPAVRSRINYLHAFSGERLVAWGTHSFVRNFVGEDEPSFHTDEFFEPEAVIDQAIFGLRTSSRLRQASHGELEGTLYQDCTVQAVSLGDYLEYSSLLVPTRDSITRPRRSAVRSVDIALPVVKYNERFLYSTRRWLTAPANHQTIFLVSPELGVPDSKILLSQITVFEHSHEQSLVRLPHPFQLIRSGSIHVDKAWSEFASWVLESPAERFASQGGDQWWFWEMSAFLAKDSTVLLAFRGYADRVDTILDSIVRIDLQSHHSPRIEEVLTICRGKSGITIHPSLYTSANVLTPKELSRCALEDFDGERLFFRCFGESLHGHVLVVDIITRDCHFVDVLVPITDISPTDSTISL